MNRLNLTACIIGSMRYLDMFQVVARKYTEIGYNVLYSPYNTYEGNLDEEKREELFIQSGKDRITMSNLVIVVDGSRTGTIGMHTLIELGYAIYLKKDIIFVETNPNNRYIHDLPVFNYTSIMYASDFSEKVAIISMIYKILESKMRNNCIITRFDPDKLDFMEEVVNLLGVRNYIDIILVGDDFHVNKWNIEAKSYLANTLIEGNIYLWESGKTIPAKINSDYELSFASEKPGVENESYHIGRIAATDEMIYSRLISEGIRVTLSIIDAKMNKTSCKDKDTSESEEVY